ncbi:hypothetical protein [Bradyrhizobium sp.]|uniref:hypothetical protein n=1 Tax=Bradyrhizobium sp. TaxID=376 RepID=UPI002B9D6321|nr:hypothetical protein [Bradyrhizobium sp.]HWX57563.1 hypothetical protein [Bradyrhizobium sp.]
MDPEAGQRLYDTVVFAAISPGIANSANPAAREVLERAITVNDGLGEDYLVKQYLQLHGVK